MKKIYFLAGTFLLAAAGTASAQGTELFFSEYNEGAHPSMPGPNNPCPGQTATSTGREKTMEVYNPTTSTVDLATYSVRRYSNGGTAIFQEERLQRNTNGTVNSMAPSSTFVLGNEGVSISAITSVLAQRMSPYGPVMNSTVIIQGGPLDHNGNDAMALVRYPTMPTAGVNSATGIIIDIFGIIGHDPTNSGWNATDANGVYTSSANQSLVRRPAVSGGNAQWNTLTNSSLDPTLFNITTEWESYGTAFPTGGTPDPCGQAYNDLGQHTYTGPNGTYAPLGLLADFNNAIQLYPNPASGRVNVALGSAKVGQLTVINALGRAIYARPASDATTATLDVTGLPAGLYFVRCQSADGQLTIYKELVVTK